MGNSSKNPQIQSSQETKDLIQAIKSFTTGDFKIMNQIQLKYQGSTRQIILDLKGNMLKLIKYEQSRAKNISNDSLKVQDLKEWAKMPTVDQILKAIKERIDQVQKRQKQMKQMKKITSLQVQKETSKVQTLLNLVQTGMHVYNTFIFQKLSQKPQIAIKKGTYDSSIYQYVQSYTLWMKIVPSFNLFLKVIKREVGIQALKFPNEREEWVSYDDKFYSISASQFKQEMIEIIERVLKIYQLWKNLQNYLTNPKVISLKGQERQNLKKYVKQMSQLAKPNFENRFNSSNMCNRENQNIDESEKLKQQINKLKKQLQTADKTNLNLLDSRQKYEQQIRRLNSQIDELKRKPQSVNFQEVDYDLKKSIRKQMEEMQNKICQFQQSIKQKIDFIEKRYTPTIEMLSKVNLKLQNQLKQKKNAIKKIENQLGIVIKQKDVLEQTNLKLQNQLKQKKNAIKKIENQLGIVIKQKDVLEQTNLNLQNQLKQKKNALQKIENQLEIAIKQKNVLNCQLSQAQRHLQNTEEKLKIQESLNEKLFQDSKYKSEQIEKLVYSLQDRKRCMAQYFSGRILNATTQEDSEWFVTNLEQRLDRKIRFTLPLYKFDPKNLTSFHDYIDYRPRIAIIIKMKTGQIIAAYSEPAFIPKTNYDYQTGIIFSFRNRKIFTVKKEPSSKANKTIPKPITYDDYYIMWGNSDIRIRLGNNELYSNYATGNCSYEERENPNSSVNDLFLQQERDAELVDYEFYQVEFEEQRF